MRFNLEILKYLYIFGNCLNIHLIIYCFILLWKQFLIWRLNKIICRFIDRFITFLTIRMNLIRLLSKIIFHGFFYFRPLCFLLSFILLISLFFQNHRYIEICLLHPLCWFGGWGIGNYLIILWIFWKIAWVY